MGNQLSLQCRSKLVRCVARQRSNSGRSSVCYTRGNSLRNDSQRLSLGDHRYTSPSHRHSSTNVVLLDSSRKARCLSGFDRKPLSLLSAFFQYASVTCLRLFNAFLCDQLANIPCWNGRFRIRRRRNCSVFWKPRRLAEILSQGRRITYHT